MELKAARATGLAALSRLAVNPFNGIERDILLQAGVVVEAGIQESIQWN